MNVTNHPNGFVVRLIHQFKNGARLRLHTWASNRPDRSDPHDHRTWFISLPLWGRFVEYRFKEVDGSIPIYRCRSSTDKERLDIFRDGQSAVQVISKHIRYPFIPYICRKEVIHSYSPMKNSFSASLVFFGKPTERIPRAWIKEQ
jgi:hypothetical protein